MSTDSAPLVLVFAHLLRPITVNKVLSPARVACECGMGKPIPYNERARRSRANAVGEGLDPLVLVAYTRGPIVIGPYGPAAQPPRLSRRGDS